MAERESYNTKQKDIIFNIIKMQRQEFTIKDIYHQVENKTGLTTIYRLVDKLVEDGRLRKYIGKDNVMYYQYLEECNEENHFYLKCNRCGMMIHIDCDCIDDLSKHIFKKHKFQLSRKQIIINGVCEKCFSNGEQE